MNERTVFFVSDGTAITAETFGTAILQQFRVPVQQVRMPFVNSPAKAHKAVQRINATYETEGIRPLVFSTLVEDEVREILRAGCKGRLLDMFSAFVQPLEDELGVKALGRCPRKTDKHGEGLRDVSLEIAGVRVEPGETTLQRTPKGASSRPTQWLRLTSAALDAQ